MSVVFNEYSNELHYLEYKITGFNLDILSFENFLDFLLKLKLKINSHIRKRKHF